MCFSELAIWNWEDGTCVDIRVDQTYHHTRIKVGWILLPLPFSVLQAKLHWCAPALLQWAVPLHCGDAYNAALQPLHTRLQRPSQLDPGLRPLHPHSPQAWVVIFAAAFNSFLVTWRHTKFSHLVYAFTGENFKNVFSWSRTSDWINRIE